MKCNVKKEKERKKKKKTVKNSRFIFLLGEGKIRRSYKLNIIFNACSLYILTFLRYNFL